MSQISVSLSMLLNSLTGAIDAAYTQSSDPSPINSTQLNANLTSLVANAIAPKLPAGMGAIVGGIGSTAAGIGLGVSLGVLFDPGASSESKVSAGLSALGGVAGIIASNPLTPPPARLAALLAQAALTGISGAIGRDPSLYAEFLEYLQISVDWLDSALNFDSDTTTQSRRLFQESQFTSPLILDLDGNGIVATTGLGSGTFFDHDGNGLAESTGWVGSGDALLVRDLNGNGRIDDGNELFGNQTDLVNGTNAANGFAALATLDANGDGQVNAQDGSGWSSLRLWRDLNGNGLSEAGELLSLQDAGISSLGTAYSGNANPTDAQGNQHRQLGSFTRTDGSTGAMHDVWFATDPVIQRNANPVAVNETIAALPDMQGLGNVRSLRQAMARACVRSVQRGWVRPYKYEHRRQACAHQPGHEHHRRDQDRAAKSHRIPAQPGAVGGV